MGKKLIFVFVCLSSVLQAQDLAKGERKFLLKATGSLYKANQLRSNLQHYYVGGNLEYFFADKYSFRGDIYTLVGERNNVNFSMRSTTQLTAGFNRHFAVNGWSPFVGVYTGMTQLHSSPIIQDFVTEKAHPDIQYIPLVGITAGVQYYFYKYFHFYAEARFTHEVSPYASVSIDEISYTAGLGFHIPMKKVK